MSRIGRKPVVIPSGVKVEQSGQHIKVSGPLGALGIDCAPSIQVKVDNSTSTVVLENKNPQVREDRQKHGTIRRCWRI